MQTIEAQIKAQWEISPEVDMEIICCRHKGSMIQGQTFTRDKDRHCRIRKYLNFKEATISYSTTCVKPMKNT